MHPRLRAGGFAVALLALASLGSVAGGATLQGQMPPGVQDSLASLADQPASHTGVVFDRSMMQVAQGLLQQGGLEADRGSSRVDQYQL